MNSFNNGPLAGLEVVDFSTLLPGPYASMLLANMGARVLKIESPTRPDIVRSLPPFVGGRSAADLQLNRDKRSVAINLKSVPGREIALNLIGDADVLLEQFRPGAMGRLGLGYEDLRAQFPALVYCSLTGYGQTGPWKQRAGHDLNYMAVAGMSSYTGRAGEAPLPLGAQYADIAGGSHHAVMGIMAALLARQGGGEGRHVDIAMTDAMFAMNGLAGAAALATGTDPGQESEWSNGGSFYDHYRCADGRYLALGGLEPQFVDTLAEILADPELRGLKNLQDQPLQRKLKLSLQKIFAARPSDHWLKQFADRDVCVTPVLTVNEAAAHEQLRARGMVGEVTLEDGTSVRQLGDPIKFSPSGDKGGNRPAPVNGQHTREVLLGAGFSASQVDEWHRAGVVFDAHADRSGD